MRIDDILDTSAENSETRHAIGDAGLANGGIASGARPYCNGFFCYGTPAPPTNGSAAQAVWYRDGNDATIVGGSDNRWAANLGTLGDGSFGFATNSAAVIKIIAESDLVALQTTGQDSGLSQQVLNDGANNNIVLRNGRSSITIKDDSITMMVGNSTSIVLKDDQVRINANVVYVDGGRVEIGTTLPGVPRLPAAIGPQPGLNATRVKIAI